MNTIIVPQTPVARCSKTFIRKWRRLRLNIGQLLLVYLLLLACSLSAFPNKLPPPSPMFVHIPTSAAVQRAQMKEQLAIEALRHAKTAHNRRALCLAQLEWSEAWSEDLARCGFHHG